MPGFRRPFRSLAEFHAERLECLRICWHRELAVAAALNYCVQNQLSAPRWLVIEGAGVVGSLLSPIKSGRRGRASGAVARYRQDMIDHERFDAVREVRERQSELRRQVQELHTIPNVPQSLLKDREKLLFWAGRDWLRAYECAAMLLADTAASGGPDAMKASYLRVKRNSKDPLQALRYHMFERDLPFELNPKSKSNSRTVRKIVPLYDLVL